MKIIWKNLSPEFPNYSVSSCGKVRNDRTNYEFKLQKLPSGYLRAALISHDGKCKYKLVHHLVAFAFLNYTGLNVIDHIDRNPSNNHINNLRNVTQTLNCRNKQQSSNKSRSVFQKDLNGQLIKKWDRIKDAPCCRGNISLACRGRIKSACGFRWSYADNQVELHEEWKYTEINEDSIGFSNLGRVFLPSGKITYGHMTKSGYYSINGQRVHRLICELFNGPPSSPDQIYVDHIDRNKINNKPSNLRWTTPKENRKNSDEIFRDVRKCQITSIDPLGNETNYSSMEEAALKTGLSKGNICMCCKGKRKKSGGLFWKYRI